MPGLFRKAKDKARNLATKNGHELTFFKKTSPFYEIYCAHCKFCHARVRIVITADYALDGRPLYFQCGKRQKKTDEE